MTASAARAGVRLVRAPRTVPMYEDEATRVSDPRLVPGSWGIEVPLPFDRSEQDATLHWLADRSRRSRSRAAGRGPGPGRDSTGTGRRGEDNARALTRAETHRLTAGFLQSLVEIATGRRSRHQLRGRMTSDSLPCVEKLASAARGSEGRGRRLALGRVTASQPTPWAIEFAGTVRTGDRNRALAGRLEMQQSQWVCTALTLLVP